jgi:hypothetical protein
VRATPTLALVPVCPPLARPAPSGALGPHAGGSVAGSAQQLPSLSPAPYVSRPLLCLSTAHARAHVRTCAHVLVDRRAHRWPARFVRSGGHRSSSSHSRSGRRSSEKKSARPVRGVQIRMKNQDGTKFWRDNVFFWSLDTPPRRLYPDHPDYDNPNRGEWVLFNGNYSLYDGLYCLRTGHGPSLPRDLCCSG